MILGDMRKRIDDVDDEILRSLNKRAQICADIGRAKAEAKVPLQDLDRDYAIAKRMLIRSAGPLAASDIVRIWNFILAGCSRVEDLAFQSILDKEKGRRP